MFWIVAAIVALVAVIVPHRPRKQPGSRTYLGRRVSKLIKSAIQTVWDWIKQYWPLLLVILTGPIGAAILLIVKNWDKIKDAAMTVYNWLKDTFSKVFDTVKDAATTALDLILAPINAIKSAFDAVVEAVKKVIDWISKIKIPDLGGIVSKLNPFTAAAPAGHYTTPRRTRPPARPWSVTATRGSGPNERGRRSSSIQGAIDPVSTAKQVRQILRDDQRRRTAMSRSAGGSHEHRHDLHPLPRRSPGSPDGAPGDPRVRSNRIVRTRGRPRGRDTTVDQPRPVDLHVHRQGRTRRRLGGDIRSFLGQFHTRRTPSTSPPPAPSTTPTRPCRRSSTPDSKRTDPVAATRHRTPPWALPPVSRPRWPTRLQIPTRSTAPAGGR